MDESLWSARNVAEYAYCPRLFYFMGVEGVFLPSSDTERGAALHRTVNRPSVLVESEEGEERDSPDRPKVVRSLVLTSEILRVTATLDLAEISGEVAVPVEYRKGSPKCIETKALGDDGAHGSRGLVVEREAWPTDRVQVG